ncbi:hypothetical protein LDENG_00126720 [Lucifuga dentata]|nr:hypothetical protein LDENG_00126720 [Lucifuga dentata]
MAAPAEICNIYWEQTKPAAGARGHPREGWQTNCPKPEDIVQLWNPALKVSVQNGGPWPSKTLVETKGKGLLQLNALVVVTSSATSTGESSQLQRGGGWWRSDETRWATSFSSRQEREREMWLSMPRHSPASATRPGNRRERRISHSRKRPVVRLLHCRMVISTVILFKAVKDIRVDEEVTFDYGVHWWSFQGEGLDLKWLNE